MNDQSVYLRDILERIQRIEEFIAGGQTAFYQSLLIQDAVIRGFEVIGEAVKHLSPELKQAHIPASPGGKSPVFETYSFTTMAMSMSKKSGMSLNIIFPP